MLLCRTMTIVGAVRVFCVAAIQAAESNETEMCSIGIPFRVHTAPDDGHNHAHACSKLMLYANDDMWNTPTTATTPAEIRHDIPALTPKQLQCTPVERKRGGEATAATTKTCNRLRKK